MTVKCLPSLNKVIYLLIYFIYVNFIPVKIWRRLETGVAPIVKSQDSDGTLAEVQYNGHIKLFTPAILSISCIMDMTMYPFDIQRCNLKFGE